MATVTAVSSSTGLSKDGFDDLGAIDSPKLETLWKCETCGKSSPAAMRLCPVCRGRLRPPGLV